MSQQFQLIHRPIPSFYFQRQKKKTNYIVNLPNEIIFNGILTIVAIRAHGG